jgi:DNA polymerase-3 subunit beta
MQLIQSQRDDLLKPLQTVSGIVERRHTLPILANILIRKQGTLVSFISTDIEIQITTFARIGKGNEEAGTTVAARKLLDILRALPDNHEVGLSLSDKKLNLASGKSKFKLQTLAAEDFPLVAKPESYNVSFTISQKTLKHLFAMVHFSMAQQDIRYYLNGLLLVTENKQVKAVSTDGHRLAFCAVELEQDLPKYEAIIPRKTILELQRLLGDGDDPVKIEIAPNQVRFTFGEVEFISKLVEGKFPDFNRVIPTGYNKHFSLSRAQFLSALQRASILTSDKFRGVRLAFEHNTLRITSTNSEHEDAFEELEIEFPYDLLEIGFNVSYLLDALSSLKDEQLQISLGDSNSSALITLPNDDGFKYVVMPMRI